MRKKDKHIVDELFSREIKDYTRNPPPEIWEGIREGMQSKSRRLLPVYLRIAAGIALLSLIGLGYYFSGKMNTAMKGKLAETENLSPPGEKESNTDKQAESTGKPSELAVPVMEDQSEKLSYTPETDTLKGRQEYTLNRVRSTYSESIPASGKDSPFIANPTISTSGIPLHALTEETDRDAITQKHAVQSAYTWEDLVPGTPSPSPENKDKRISIAATLSPIYSYRNVGDNASEISRYLDQNERGKISYSGGVDLGYSAGERFSIHTGLVYARMGIGVNEIYANYSHRGFLDNYESVITPQALVVSNSTGIIMEGNPNAETNFISSNATDKVEIREGQPVLSETVTDNTGEGQVLTPADGSINQFIHILEIPVMFKYKLIDRRIDLKVLGGLSTNLLLGSRVYYSEGGNTEQIGTLDDLRTFNYSGNLGLGINTGISKELEFIFEPLLKYYLNSINGPDNYVESRPWSFGLYTGFRYNF